MHSATDEQRLLARQHPGTRPVMYQAWRSLLFLHWQVDPSLLENLLPPQLTLDVYGGGAWLGIVPFSMQHVHPRGLPEVRWLSNFLELNLRTYVVDSNGTPGVWFFSLDAERWIATRLGRWWFSLPYHWSRMSMQTDSEQWIEYRNHRKGTPEELASRFQYRPSGDLFQAQPGSLEFFLAERYFLFCMVRGKGLCRGQVHHRPYPLQQVDVSVYDENILRLNHIPPSGKPYDHALFSPGVSVEIFPLARV